MELEIKIEHITLGLILFIGVLFIFLAFNTQMLGEDEGVYHSLGEKFLSGEYPTSRKNGGCGQRLPAEKGKTPD